MANPKNPEQRSSASSKKAQPTGEEVYKATSSAEEATPDAAEGQQAQTSDGPSYEELGQIAADLKQQVARLYTNNQLYAEERAVPLIGVGFVVGLVIGMITGRS
ncbi:MAG: hypothetical protein ACR2GR_08850 [Rhodothermales bacterium]